MRDFFCIFVASNYVHMLTMNKSIRYGAVLLLLFVMPFAAFSEEAVMHRVLFHSGRVVVGEIVLRNDEVVIVKDSYGAKFQFPMSDVVEITEVIDQEASEKHEEEVVSRKVSNVKRTSLGLRVVGGVASMGGGSIGGVIGADARLGANNLAGKHIFLGGQVGYRLLLMGAGERKPSIIPISAALELPLTEGTHVPMVGANIGYGIGTGGVLGGVNAGMSLAYRYHFSRTGAFHVGVGAEVQQFARYSHQVEVEPGQAFTDEGGRTAVMGVITLGVLF